MINQDSDLERLRSGEMTQFDSQISDMITIRILMNKANDLRRVQHEGAYRGWMYILHTIEAELSAYMSPKQAEELQKLRVNTLPGNKGKGVLHIAYKKLDTYHRKLIEVRGEKGLGLRATEDAGSAVLR